MRKVRAISPSNSNDRFDLRSFLPIISNDNLMAQDSFKNGFFADLRRLPVAGQYTVLDEISDWPLVSYKLFKTTTLWWILCFYNAYDNPADLAQGDVLAYPSAADIDFLFFKYARRNVQLAPQEMLPDRRSYIDFPYYLFYEDSATWIRRTPSGTFAVFQVDHEYVARIDDDGNIGFKNSLSYQTEAWFTANLSISNEPIYYDETYGIVLCVRSTEWNSTLLKPVFYPVLAITKDGDAIYRHQITANCASGGTVIAQTPSYVGISAIVDYTDISMNGEYNVLELRREIVPFYSTTEEGYHILVRGTITAPTNFELEAT